MTDTKTLSLFEGFGIEIEYMIVATDTLDVAPVCDWLMEQVAGEITDEFDNGAIAWNNELAMHVVEFKTNGPAADLSGVGADFQANVVQANTILAERNLRLLPTATHPWMDPATEVKLWPYHQQEIYQAFDRVFGCSGHGWGNLQSMQINLPFSGDAEFGKLHAAIRLVLPLIPGLAASSPVMDGRINDIVDNRMRVYTSNCARVPSVTSTLIPEPVYSIDGYHKEILQKIYADLAQHDPDKILSHEWVNARGAIARFDRMAIEMRVIDSQEHPGADIAFAELISGVVRLITEETWVDIAQAGQWPTRGLVQLFDSAAADGELAEIHDGRFLRLFGCQRSTATLRQLWEHLTETLVDRGMLRSETETVIENYLHHGTLARRILNALPKKPQREHLREVYRQLADCLAEGQLFVPAR